MTDHPLTDEMIQEIGRSVGGYEFNDSCHAEMRAAYDKGYRDASGDVIERLKNSLEDLKQAMRSQEQEDN